ncbi:PREDICTED: defensin-like protein 24 [Camelina sativa]|uniref:Defensin-like protein 24 n=1 Tax=Camelina sativa TaxID=90675 RepID=A0ABM1QSX3_CAMSA|nr:PREDICTED: defensin-like protein 24 [Camelina sativa]
MAYSKIVIFAILALSLLLSGAETRNAVLPGSELFEKCCTDLPEFGNCETKKDDQRCKKMCLDGCSMNKGGACQPISAAFGPVCSCYC